MTFALAMVQNKSIASSYLCLWCIISGTNVITYTITRFFFFIWEILVVKEKAITITCLKRIFHFVSSPAAPTSAMTTSSQSPTSVCGRCSWFLSPALLWWWWLTLNSAKEKTPNMWHCTKALTCMPTPARREGGCGGPICWVWSSKPDSTHRFFTSCTGYTTDMTCPSNARIVTT